MFASTNLVIELGILILIFLGWQFLAAEIIGGLVLIAISSMLIRLTYPRRWLEVARAKVEEDSPEGHESFDWRERIRSRAGDLPGWLITLENAMVAPFVAAATFIGSMGNIPLATVLNQNGVVFAGIMGFIYSDLMVPPLVKVNAKYYGWRVALYIAGIMFVSIVATALILNGGFQLLGLVPQSGRAIEEVTRFELDYTFWLNLAFVGLAAWLVTLDRAYRREHDQPRGSMSLDVRRLVTFAFMAILLGGLLAAWATLGRA